MENKAPAEEMVTRQAKATEETKGGVGEREIGGEREGLRERERRFRQDILQQKDVQPCVVSFNPYPYLHFPTLEQLRTRKLFDALQKGGLSCVVAIATLPANCGFMQTGSSSVPRICPMINLCFEQNKPVIAHEKPPMFTEDASPHVYVQ